MFLNFVLFWGNLTVADPAAGYRVGERPRNMTSMQPPLEAMFFMTYLYRTGGGACTQDMLLQEPNRDLVLPFGGGGVASSVQNPGSTTPPPPD